MGINDAPGTDVKKPDKVKDAVAELDAQFGSKKKPVIEKPSAEEVARKEKAKETEIAEIKAKIDGKFNPEGSVAVKEVKGEAEAEKTTTGVTAEQTDNNKEEEKIQRSLKAKEHYKNIEDEIRRRKGELFRVEEEIKQADKSNPKRDKTALELRRKEAQAWVEWEENNRIKMVEKNDEYIRQQYLIKHPEGSVTTGETTVEKDVTTEEVPRQEDVVKDKELSEKAKGYLKSYFQVPDSSVVEKRAIQGMERYSADSIIKSRTEAAQNNLSLSIELERVKDKSEQSNQLLNQARRVYLNQTGGRDKFVPITKETVFEGGARNFRVLQVEDVEKLVNSIKGVIGELRGEKSVNGTTIAEKIGTLTDEDRKEIIDYFSSKLSDAEKSLGIVLALEKDLESGYKSNLEEGVVVSSKYDESLSRLGVSLEKAEERLQLPSTFKHY